MTPMVLPAILAEGASSRAADLLSHYVNDTRANGVDPAWSGSHFESYGHNDPYAITSDDLVAVSMLGVNVPAHAALCLTGREAGAIAELLREIPSDVDLAADESLQTLSPGGPAYRLWRLLKAHDKIGTTVASKILARKRPRLIPVQDDVVRRSVKWDEKTDFWQGLRELLRADDNALVTRLNRIRSDAGATGFSDLRVFDIVTWMDNRK